MDEPLRVELLGGLRACLDGRVIDRFRTHKTGALLAYLAYHPHRAHSREVLIDVLWPEADLGTGRNNLNLALSSLRRQLEPAGVPRGAILRTGRLSVQLGAVTTDVAEFLQALQAAGQAPTEGTRYALLRQAVETYRGELLPGYYEEWVLDEQHRLGALYEAAVQELSILGGPEAGRGIASAARSPSAGPQPAPPQRTPPVRLPATFTRFFGREEELARLTQLLSPCSTVAPSPHRLITLSGPGGVGKTRLAIEAARRSVDAFAGGVWFVPLADLTDPHLIMGAIANALGLPPDARVEPLGHVVEFLNRPPQPCAGLHAGALEPHQAGGSAPTLLILDNFEQVAAGGAHTVQVLLSRAPSLTLLITSRQSLSVPGEFESPVGPLPIPQEAETPASLLVAAGFRLLVDRVQAKRPGFQVTARNAEAIAQLCRMLEGIPLAIELAAARASSLSPGQMAERLRERFELLVDRRADGADRHRSLWAALDWSYHLLPPELRRLFARLGIFRGGWTLQAAESVCEEPYALDRLAELRARSLILTDEEATEMRFRMLETVREFAWEQLTPAERADTRRRHLEYYVALAEGAAPHYGTAGQAGWLDRLDKEAANLRLALDESTASPSLGLRLVGALGRYWEMRGHYSEGRERIATAVERAEGLGRTEARARALQWGGFLAHRQGDYPTARLWYEESLAIWRELGSRKTISADLNNLGLTVYAQGEDEAARSLFEAGLSIARAIEDRGLVAYSLGNLGIVARNQGDLDLARALHSERLALYRQIGNGRPIAYSLGNLGLVAYAQGDHALAWSLFEESLGIWRELDAKPGIATALAHLGLVASSRGKSRSASALYKESLAILRESGDRLSIADVLEALAFLAWTQSPPQRVRAGRLWGAVEALREVVGAPEPTRERTEQERRLAAIREAADSGTLAAAWAEGRAMSVERAILYALEDEES